MYDALMKISIILGGICFLISLIILGVKYIEGEDMGNWHLYWPALTIIFLTVGFSTDKLNDNSEKQMLISQTDKYELIQSASCSDSKEYLKNIFLDKKEIVVSDKKDITAKLKSLCVEQTINDFDKFVDNSGKFSNNSSLSF